MDIFTIANLFMLSVGFGCLVLGTAAVIKIYKGSRITFACIMTAFTCAYGVVFVVKGVMVLYYNGPEWSFYVY